MLEGNNVLLVVTRVKHAIKIVEVMEFVQVVSLENFCIYQIVSMIVQHKLEIFMEIRYKINV